MLLSWLSKLCASLLNSILLVLVLAFTLNQTVLNPHYIESQLQGVNAYSKISDGIVTEVAKNSADSGISQADLTSKLKTIITPQVVKAKLNLTLAQIQAYYLHGGTVPGVNVSDLLAQAQAAGVPIQDSTLSKPIKLGALADTKKFSDKLTAARIAVITAVVVLAGAMVAIAFKRQKFTPLANILITLGVTVMLFGGVMLIGRYEFNKNIIQNYHTNAFTGAAKDLANSMGADIVKRLLITGGILLLLGIASLLGLKYHKKKVRLPRLNRPTPAAPNPAANSGYLDALSDAPVPPTKPTPNVPTAPKLTKLTKIPPRKNPPKPPQLIQ